MPLVELCTWSSHSLDEHRGCTVVR
jgi:hypothetical protein